MTFITTSERSAKSITVSERAKVGISATAREALTFQDGVPNLRFVGGTATGAGSATLSALAINSAAGVAIGDSIATLKTEQIFIASGVVTGDSLSTVLADAIVEADGLASGNSVSACDAFGVSAISAEVQAVFDRMSALTTTEKDAIEVFVDGMVSDGLWASMIALWCPAFNNTDFLTDFIDDVSPMNIVGGSSHTAGEYIEFTSTQHALTPNVGSDYNFTGADPYPICLGSYQVQTQADTTANTDFFGFVDGVLEVYMRWRGNDVFDFNVTMGKTSINPRPALNVKPTGDIVVLGGNSTTEDFISSGAVVNTMGGKTQEGFPNLVIEFNGRNSSGTPQQRRGARHSLWFIAEIDSSDILTARARMLQFLIDFGVTGVPTP